ncbi:hypothetical protein L208DRAFT_153376 [Tricholoma matsutake]|nr:hypothetical protein L208DRAFT_153376 [Tricholoma matsutake 945]
MSFCNPNPNHITLKSTSVLSHIHSLHHSFSRFTFLLPGPTGVRTSADGSVRLCFGRRLIFYILYTTTLARSHGAYVCLSVCIHLSFVCSRLYTHRFIFFVARVFKLYICFLISISIGSVLTYRRRRN